MKSTKSSLISFMAALTVLLSGAAAAADTVKEQATPEHKFNLAKQYYGQCKNVSTEDFDKVRPYLKAFTDAAVMAETMADPLRFAQLLQVVNDPRTMHVMMKCSTEPVMWETWMRGLTNPAHLMNAAVRFMDPNVYMKWMMAPMNPAFYSPAMAMMNPAYYTNWVNASMNPVFYEPFFAFANPNWYLPRMQWMMAPASYQPMFNMFGMNTMPVAKSDSAKN